MISAKNTATNSNLSEREALQQGVLDENKVTYTDKKTGKQVLIADAIQVTHHKETEREESSGLS